MSIVQTQLDLISKRSKERSEEINKAIRETSEKDYSSFRVNKVLPVEEKRI
jgi:hypothetical protein